MSFRRFVLLLSLAAAAMLTLPSSAAAWKYKFQDFIDFQGGAIAGSVITAKKCQGGLLGTYDFRSYVASESSDGSTYLEVEVEAGLPVTHQFKPFKNVNVTVVGTIDPGTIEQARDALADFYNSVEVKYKPEKLLIEHGPLVIFGAQVVAAGSDKTKFKPKPGC